MVHEDVIEFEVSMGITFLVHVGYAADQLLEDVLTGILGQALILLLLDVMEATPT